MPPIVTTNATIVCIHGGQVTLLPRQVQVQIQGGNVLCEGDLSGAPIVGCAQPPSPGTKPCTLVVSTLPGSLGSDRHGRGATRAALHAQRADRRGPARHHHGRAAGPGHRPGMTAPTAARRAVSHAGREPIRRPLRDPATRSVAAGWRSCTSRARSTSTARGAEGAVGVPRQRPGLRRALPARVTPRRLPQPPEHRDRARVLRARRHAVHRDGVHRAGLAAAVRRQALARAGGRRRSRACSRGSHTPRRRASCTATSSPRTSWSPRRARQDRGLRHREGGLRRDRTVPDSDGNDGRDARLHGARAGDGGRTSVRGPTSTRSA